MKLSEHIMNNYFFNLSTKIYFGAGSLKELKEARNLGKKALLVTGKHFAKRSGLLKRVESILLNNRIRPVEFCDAEENPSVETVEKGGKLARGEKCDFVIGLGGGSAMDTAKGIAVLATNPGGLREYFGSEKLKSSPLPVLAIPTTSGTGSEVTRYAVINDWQARTKKVVSSFSILPRIAIIDPSLTLTLPRNLTASTGMDAFSHALEGYLSTDANFLTEILSIEAIKIIKKYLPLLLKKNNLFLREKLSLAALYAGMVINRTGTIIVHGMGYSLTLDYGLQHGAANALLLPYVADYLVKDKIYQKRLQEILKTTQAKESLLKLNQRLNLPLTLREIGVKKKDLKALSRRAIKDCGRALLRISIPLKEKDFLLIYKNAFE